MLSSLKSGSSPESINARSAQEDGPGSLPVSGVWRCGRACVALKKIGRLLLFKDFYYNWASEGGKERGKKNVGGGFMSAVRGVCVYYCSTKTRRSKRSPCR
jgi:hypothetical protein